MNNWKSILMTNCCFFFFWMSNDFILGNNIMLLFFTLTYMYSVYFLLPLGTWTPFNPETVRLMIGKNHTLRSTLHTFLAKGVWQQTGFHVLINWHDNCKLQRDSRSRAWWQGAWEKRQVKLKDKTGSVVEVFLFLGVASI